MEEIYTERLIIRRPRETDLNDFLAYRNDAAVLKYLPDQPVEEATALNNLKKQVLLHEEQATGWIMFAVEHRQQKKMIGEVGIFISPNHQHTGDIGWSFNKDYHSSGYATEAASAFLSYIFELRRLEQVTASCVSANTASFMLMQRLGMHRVDDHVQVQYIDRVPYDEYLYRLSKIEWLSNNGHRPVSADSLQ